MDGFSVSRKLEKLGWHASDTAELIAFDDVFVPDENLLGEENKGFYLIMANFQWERLVMALGAVGAMQALLERTLEFARERERVRPPDRQAPGDPPQARRDGGDALEAGARAHLQRAAPASSTGEDAVREVTMAKLATQRAAFDVADDVPADPRRRRLHEEYDIERAARDARLGPIGGGTDEIMKEILGKTLGL